MGRKFLKRGFTLIETVVTIGIVATMAAVVIPQVAKQADSADPTRLQNDLKNLQTAIETFTINEAGLHPGDLDDLVNQITNADTNLTTAATGLPKYISTSQTSLWKGPYVDFALADAQSTDQTHTTGYNATILDTFVCYDNDNTHVGTSQGVATAAADDQACPTGGTTQKFLAIQITGLATAATDATFTTLNTFFDGANESTPENNGRIRFRTVGTNKVVYFLVGAL